MADIQKGISKLGEIMGEQAAKGAYEQIRKFDEGFAELVVGTTFGEVWARPGLPTKLRSLATVAGLIVLGRGPELRAHIQGALRVGWTPEELKEVIIHMSQYGGMPTTIEAMRIFEEVTKKK